MIVDSLDNWRATFRGPLWTQVFHALEQLTPETPEGETRLDGDNLIMRVMSYDTRPPEQGALEAHRDYIDVQMPLVAGEGIDWYPVSGLAVRTAYDAAKDVIFFERPTRMPVRVNLFPGSFCVLLPTDAHMPQLMTGNAPERIKKVVVKVRANQVSAMT